MVDGGRLMAGKATFMMGFREGAQKKARRMGRQQE
jgi:hypothetical protein